jgi:hypothetical protein
MDKSSNSEKIMFLQNLLDDFGFKFEETLNSVTVSGVQSVENYQTFIRHLTYVITNINEVNKDKLDLIENKKFYISCIRSEPNIETNTILIQLNLTHGLDTVVNVNAGENEAAAVVMNGKADDGFIAHKQAQKLVVSDDDGDILQRRIEDFTFKNGNKKTASSPATIAILVMCSCAVGFLLVFGAVKVYLNRNMGKRKGFPNEENPQMEWDDSGLNITENPLENLEVCKETQNTLNAHHAGRFDDDEYTSSEEYDGVDSNDSNEDDDMDDDDVDNDADDYGLDVEEPEKIIDRELEWDDTSLEIKIRDKQLQLEKQQEQQHLSNKKQTTSHLFNSNKI